MTKETEVIIGDSILGDDAGETKEDNKKEETKESSQSSKEENKNLTAPNFYQKDEVSAIKRFMFWYNVNVPIF